MARQTLVYLLLALAAFTSTQSVAQPPAHTYTAADGLYQQALKTGVRGDTKEGLAKMIDAGKNGSFLAAMHLAQMYAFGDASWSVHQDLQYARVWVVVSEEHLKRPENAVHIGSETHLRLLSLLGAYGKSDQQQRTALRQCVHMARAQKAPGYQQLCESMSQKIR